ncbi:MAG: 3'(2'),5'-bisphosphate nucleotidase [Betaproteobacteria bacterium RIFCSPLOWO2_12_FULL_63_13]|nr:MAG: 3'(2'),5'-bisphosphate nucleotidase [Betaproteobacteria bacterium RIFCSPLOWO2_12_FULL_63_13]
MPLARKALLEDLLPLAREAGKIIMEVYATDFAVRGKADRSPVTEADEKAEAVILSGLVQLTPEIPIVSEEAAAEGRIPVVGETFWLVDPLDGTREFVNRNGEFTVNIALIDDGVPVAGVVFAPAPGELYAGSIGAGAFVEDIGGRRAIACALAFDRGLVVVSSRSHGDAEQLEQFLAGRSVASSITVGSSLKFCLLACGKADLYPRLGRTMEWDTAAGHAVLLAAGGRVTDLAGQALRYGKPDFVNPHFVASGV